MISARGNCQSALCLFPICYSGYFVGIQQIDYQAGVVISGIASDLSSAAATAGIQPNDIAIAVNGNKLGSVSTSYPKLDEEIQTHPQEKLNFEIQRDNETLNIFVTPDVNAEGKGQIGVKLSANGRVITDRDPTTRSKLLPKEQPNFSGSQSSR